MSLWRPILRHIKLSIFLLLVFVVVLVTVKGAGRFVSTPTHLPEQADLIVTLGGDGGSRVREAARLYAKGYASTLLLTGIDRGDPELRPTYLSWRAAYLVQLGIPETALLLDTQSANSWQEAHNTRLLMETRGWKRVLVVSDPPHMRRLSWVWASAFKESGLEYRIIPSPMPDWSADHWLANEKSAQFVLMELIKLGYYTLAY